MILKYFLPVLALSIAAFQSPSLAVSMGVGPKGGVNFAGADVDDVKNQERRTGASLGLAAEFGVTSPWSLMVEAQYLQRGARFDVVGIEAEGDLDYLEIPVLVKAKFGSTAAHAYAFAGPSLGLKLSSEGRYAGFADAFEEEAATFTISGDVGAGAAYQLSRYVYLNADLRYSHGFTDALEQSIGAIDSWYHRDVRLMAGILFHLTE